MTVETTGRKSKQTMTGSIVNYDFSFRALVSAPGDIKCIRTITATNTDQDMTRVTEIPAASSATDVLSYLVSIATDGIGGTVTVAWPSTACTLTIYRETTDTQSSDYEDYNQFPANTVENDFDKRTLKSQEQQEDIDRALKYAITAPTGSTLPLGEANTYLGWDANGVLLENKTLNTSGTVLVRAAVADAVAHTDNNLYMTPFLSYESSKTMGVIQITTTATIAMGIVTNLTATTLTISGSTVTSKYYKTITVETPGGAEAITMFYADEAITIEKIICVLTGTIPSVTWGLNHSTLRNTAGTSIVTGTTTDLSSGSTVTSFADATVPADSHIWFVTTATSGTIDSLSLTVQYTQDA
jgi:hypothetical protein